MSLFYFNLTKSNDQTLVQFYPETGIFVPGTFGQNKSKEKRRRN